MAESQSDDRKRVFAGSWFLVIAPIFVCCIMVWYGFSKRHLLDGDTNTIVVLLRNWRLFLQYVVMYIGGAALYYFASLVPKKVLIFRMKKKKNNDSFLGMLFQDSFKGGTVNWDVYDASGSFQRTESHYVPGIAVGIVETPIKIVIAILFYFLKAALVMYWAIINLFRNYIFLWILPKKMTGM